jgi:hypothetical protein
MGQGGQCNGVSKRSMKIHGESRKGESIGRTSLCWVVSWSRLIMHSHVVYLSLSILRALCGIVECVPSCF